MGSLPHLSTTLATHNVYEHQEVDPMLCDEGQGSGSSAPPPHSAPLLTRIPKSEWDRVAHRYANGESLRQLAKVYGVSHEAVRQIIKKVAA